MFPDDIQELDDITSRVVGYKDEGAKELRFSVSEFRGKLYLSLRWWRLDFEDEWMPTKEGCTLPYQLSVVGNLYSALTDLLSEAEVLEKVLEKTNSPA